MDANNNDKSQKNALKQKTNKIRQFFFHILFHFDEYLMRYFYSNDNETAVISLTHTLELE